MRGNIQTLSRLSQNTTRRTSSTLPATLHKGPSRLVATPVRTGTTQGAQRSMAHNHAQHAAPRRPLLETTLRPQGSVALPITTKLCGSCGPSKGLFFSTRTTKALSMKIEGRLANPASRLSASSKQGAVFAKSPLRANFAQTIRSKSSSSAALVSSTSQTLRPLAGLPALQEVSGNAPHAAWLSSPVRKFTDDSGFHDDFKAIRKNYEEAPAAAGAATGDPSPEMANETRTQIEKIIKENPIVVFMKGTPEAPRCGFSAGVVQILKFTGISEFTAINVLTSDLVRTEIKKYTEWPTIPQVFVDGEFIGGFDVMKELHESGELKEKVLAKHITPKEN